SSFRTAFSSRVLDSQQSWETKQSNEEYGFALSPHGCKLSTSTTWRRVQMAKSVKKVEKKEVAPVVQAEAPVVQAEAPVPVVKAKKEPETAETKWRRRLARWQGKAEAQGVDAKSLMRELSA